MPTNSPPPAATEVATMNMMNDVARDVAIAVGSPIGVRGEKVAKSFGETPALHGISLDIRPGDLAALLGPSRSGKAALLRILPGLVFPAAGRVPRGGEDALSLSTRE